MPNTYKVTETATGRLIVRGDTVTSFRGNTGTFEMVTRGVEYNGTAKVLVGGREYYERVWGLTVETIKPTEGGASLGLGGLIADIT